MPGGHLEYGETLVDAARREMKEELGIDIPNIQLLTVAENINDKHHYIHLSFLAEEYSGEIQCRESDL